MALTNCPYCRRRISSLMSVCPHCATALTDLSSEDQERLATRRWKRLLYRALTLSYLGLTMAVAGAAWWWSSGTYGWELPPPVTAFALLLLGAVVYLLARLWMLWLRLQRKRGNH